MIENKQELIDAAREQAAVNQFDHTYLNPNNTKLAPCLWGNDMVTASSWSPWISTFETYRNRFLDLGDKYQDVFWLPLDIPRIEMPPMDQFLEVWDRESVEVVDLAAPNGKAEFRGLHIHAYSAIDYYMHDAYDKRGRLTSGYPEAEGFSISALSTTLTGAKYNRNLHKHKFWTDLIVQVMDHYPIFMISNILILEQLTDVNPHREETWAWKCPTEFRTSLYDENDTPTLYLSDIITGETKYVDLPKDTNSFCWSNGTKVYGIDYHGKRNFQLVVNAIWDVDKLNSLVEKSIKKYGKDF